MRPRLPALAMLAAALQPAAAEAYEIRRARWARTRMPVAYVIHERLANNLSDDEAARAIRAGYQHWVDVPCSYAESRYDGRTEQLGFGANDGVNITSWYTSEWPMAREAIAVTSTLADFGNGILDSDMVFNDVHFDFATDGSPGRMDIEAVATHEAGHFFGLGHSADPAATMFPTTGPANLAPRSLDTDDVEGLCGLYPTGKPPGIEIGEPCGVGASCEGELVCLGGGDDAYCTTPCEWREDCPADQGLYCVEHGEWGPMCVRFPADAPPGEALGDGCGADGACQLGLLCLRDGSASYCSGDCDIYGEEHIFRRDCPPGWRCAERRGGKLVCVVDDGEPDADAGSDAASDADAELEPAPADGGGADSCAQAAGRPSAPSLLELLGLRRG